MKYVAGPPQVQMNGMYWEAERLVYRLEAELRLLSERRAVAIKTFRAQEEALQSELRAAVELRDKYKASREAATSQGAENGNEYTQV